MRCLQITAQKNHLPPFVYLEVRGSRGSFTPKESIAGWEGLWDSGSGLCTLLPQPTERGLRLALLCGDLCSLGTPPPALCVHLLGWHLRTLRVRHIWI